MPVFPQYQNAKLVEYATFYTHSATATSAVGAVPGDVHVFNSAATGWPLALPPVVQGGPVKVVNIHATGTVIVSPNSGDSGVDVNGGASYTVPAGGTGAAATAATFTSDGANWYAS